jgi:hypothetical protein
MAFSDKKLNVSIADSVTSHINPLKPLLVQTVVKNSVRTAKKTPHFTVKNVNWITLFKEITAVYNKNHKRSINESNYRQLQQVGHTVTTGL